MTNNLGSTFWMAPEVFQNSTYDLSGNFFIDLKYKKIIILNFFLSYFFKNSGCL